MAQYRSQNYSFLLMWFYNNHKYVLTFCVTPLYLVTPLNSVQCIVRIQGHHSIV